jgi:TonB family protein
MPELPQPAGSPPAAGVPRLRVELPSWGPAFFGNARDLIFPRRLPQLELESAPAPFWPDVFVKRGLPWFSFVESGAYHVLTLTLVVALAHLMALHPAPVPRTSFDHAQVIYYAPSEYLPPLDSRITPAGEPAKADPQFARQPIISLPPEADNRSQTIVSPPNVKLKQDVALPNVVRWSEKVQKPQLEIPPVPMTPAAEISRITPRMENTVVTPPPDAAHLTRRRDQLDLHASVVAPPPQVSNSQAQAAFAAPQPAVVAPPPVFLNAPARSLGELNVGPSAVIAPAPQLPVAEQRAVSAGRFSHLSATAQVVPPPPSVSASAGAGQSFGSAGRVIALSLHPAVDAPPAPPAGNRRGTFAATPEGRFGASGSPGSSSGAAAGTGSGRGNGGATGSDRKGAGDLPAGLYVGTPAGAKSSSVAGDPSGSKAPAGAVVANAAPSVPRPHVSSAPSRPAQADSAVKLSEPERAVFGDRRFYSLTLNMPNLNSAGGSWVIRFAELTRDPRAPAADLSQPTATRKVDPGYPLQLIRENVAGTVILYAVIHANGTVGNVRVLRGVDDRLDRYASEAVAQWKFEPATKNGAPVDVEATFRIPFRPPKMGTNF